MAWYNLIMAIRKIPLRLARIFMSIIVEIVNKLFFVMIMTPNILRSLCF